jgi:methionine-rich copper-binding protein CopC
MRAIRILLAAVVALVLGAAPAVAHAPVKERTPKPGSTVSKVRTLRAVFARSLGKGSYKVKWRALADDGHHESGSWTFKVS